MILLSFCSFPWWLAWLLPFLLGLLAGWAIWAKWKSMYADMETKVSGLNKKIAGLEADLAACRKARAELDGEIALANGRVREMTDQLAAAKSKGGADSDSADKIASLESDLAACKKRNTDLQAEATSAKSAADQAQKDLTDVKGQLDTATASLAAGATGGVDVASMASGFAGGMATSGDSADSDAGSGDAGADASGGSGSSIYSGIKGDNLQIIEGIGPKMESILKENGVESLAMLAGKSTSDIQAILDKYGDKYKIIDPSTWVQQAKMAADKEWEGLIQLQKQLDTGRDSNIDLTDSKLEKILIKSGALVRHKQDDLKAIEGIGPAIEKLMHDAGINTWRGMAETSVDRLKEILEAAGSRFKLADPGTWPKQAEMAADGKFKELQEYQDFLQGGR